MFSVSSESTCEARCHPRCGVVCVVPSLKGVSTQWALCFHGQCSGGGDPVGFSFDLESFVLILVSALPVFEVFLLWSISTT